MEGAAAELGGDALFHEFELRHVFFPSEGDGPVFRDEAVVIGTSRKEIQSAAAHFYGSARGLDGRKKMQTSTAAKEGEKLALVGEALIESGSGGSGGACHAPHRKCALAAFAPQAVCGRKDAVFQTSVGFARHLATPKSWLRRIISFTALKKQIISNGSELFLVLYLQNVEAPELSAGSHDSMSVLSDDEGGGVRLARKNGRNYKTVAVANPISCTRADLHLRDKADRRQSFNAAHTFVYDLAQ
jgi:uncharacterized C2H2 Zn-finger protein